MVACVHFILDAYVTGVIIAKSKLRRLILIFSFFMKSYSIVEIEQTGLYLEIERTKLKSMVDQFAELGVRNKKLNQYITKSPQLLLRKPKDFLQVFIFSFNQECDIFTSTLFFDLNRIGLPHRFWFLRILSLVRKPSSLV